MKSQFLSSLLILAAIAVIAACDSRSTAERQEGVVHEELRKFPPFELEKLAGGSVRLEDYRGKVVVLNFWATWCAPCVAELPSLQKLQAQFANEGLEVVAVSVDPLTAKADIDELKDRLSLAFDILLDPELSLPPELGITGFPETFFIGRNGEMLEVYDPVEKRTTSRIISDRDWSSEEMMRSIGALLKR